MPLLQDYTKLFEHTENINKIYVNNNVVWPATAPPSSLYYIQCISGNGTTFTNLTDSISATRDIEISFKSVQNGINEECLLGITREVSDNNDLRLVIAGRLSTTNAAWRRFDHGSRRESGVLLNMDLNAIYEVRMNFTQLYMFNCTTNQVFVDTTYQTPTSNVQGHVRLYDILGAKIYNAKVVVNGTTLLDAKVDVNGLYDTVSQQYITLPNWTVIEE